MKKLFILFGIIVFSVGLMAQEEPSKVQVGVRAGLGGSTLLIPKSTIMNESVFGYSSEQSIKLGAMAGLVVDFQVMPKGYIQTGLLYSWQRVGQVQGARFTDSLSTQYSISSENLYTMHRLKVPLMFNYHFSTSKNHFVLGAGIFADAALAGKLTYNGSAVLTTVDNEKQSYVMGGEFNPYTNDPKQIRYSVADDDHIDLYTVSEENILNRIDFGLSLEIGYQISQFYVGAHLDFGLLNAMNPKFTTHKYDQRNMAFQLMLGYRIN